MSLFIIKRFRQGCQATWMIVDVFIRCIVLADGTRDERGTIVARVMDTCDTSECSTAGDSPNMTLISE